jgi:hypothetical protein
MSGVKALNMTVDVSKIRIGSVRLFIGEVGTAFDSAAAFNVDTPPTGWRDLGATGEDTALEATKEVFSLKTGQLNTTKFQAVIGMEGKMTATLHEFDADKVADAMGAARPFNVLRGAPTADSIQTVTSASEITLATGKGADFAVGDKVVVAAAGSLTSSPNVAIISDIDGDALTFVAALPTLPLVSDVVQKVTARKNAIGTTTITKKALLAVHDLVGGAQYVYHFPTVSAIESGFKPNFAAGRENVKLPIAFSAYGVTDADFNDTVVALQYEFE